MGRPDALDRDEMVEFVMSCWDDEAGICCAIYFLFL
jgi:geranylgeranyl transferase type-2 subunit beta